MFSSNNGNAWPNTITINRSFTRAVKTPKTSNSNKVSNNKNYSNNATSSSCVFGSQHRLVFFVHNTHILLLFGFIVEEAKLKRVLQELKKAT